MKEIEQEVARRLNKDEEHIHIVVSDLFKEVRNYFQQPDKIKHGILIHKFVRFEVNFKRMQHFIDFKEANPDLTVKQQHTLEFYKNIINKKDYYGDFKK
jgi:hypothetical protein